MINPRYDTPPYSAPITRKNPSMFLFLLDRSASMAEKIMMDGEPVKKSEALSRIINTTLEEIISRCKHFDGYYDYFDLCLLGYNNNSCEPLLGYVNEGKDICTINMLVCGNIDRITYERQRKFPSGDSFISSIKVGNYIKPLAQGNTPMLAGLKKAYAITKRWCAVHQNEYCFPPIIFNITDGEASDATHQKLLDIAAKIRKLSTADGNVLFFNIHLTKSQNGTSILFPTSEKEVEQEDRYARLLYEMSSALPSLFYPDIADIRKMNRIDPSLTVKAMGYNSNITDILKIINIGSISITKVG